MADTEFKEKICIALKDGRFDDGTYFAYEGADYQVRHFESPDPDLEVFEVMDEGSCCYSHIMEPDFFNKYFVLKEDLE